MSRSTSLVAALLVVALAVLTSTGCGNADDPDNPGGTCEEQLQSCRTNLQLTNMLTVGKLQEQVNSLNTELTKAKAEIDRLRSNQPANPFENYVDNKSKWLCVDSRDPSHVLTSSIFNPPAYDAAKKLWLMRFPGGGISCPAIPLALVKGEVLCNPYEAPKDEIYTCRRQE